MRINWHTNLSLTLTLTLTNTVPNLQMLALTLTLILTVTINWKLTDANIYLTQREPKGDAITTIDPSLHFEKMGFCEIFV